MKDIAVGGGFQLGIGPEQIIFTDGIQPFLFRTRTGALWVQGQINYPAGYRAPTGKSPMNPLGRVISRDGGKTWQRWWYRGDPIKAIGVTNALWEGTAEPNLSWGGVGMEYDDGLIQLYHEYTFVGKEPGVFNGFVYESRDDLATLSDAIPIRIEIPQGRSGFDDSGFSFPGFCLHRSALALPGSGDLLTTAYGWFHGDDQPGAYEPKQTKMRVIVLRSADRGRSWRYVSTVAAPKTDGSDDTEEGFDEATMARVSRGPRAGRLVVIMRTGSNSRPLCESHSDDEGLTWSQPRKLELCGVDPALIEMKDGTLALLVGRRVWRGKDCFGGDGVTDGYYIGLSSDGGESWTHTRCWSTEPHAGPGACMTSYSGVCEVEPGVLLAVYDVGRWGAAVRYIAARRVRVTRTS